MGLIVPASYGSGFARNKAQAMFPDLWDGLVGHWDPSLGPTGLTLYDWSPGPKNHGALTNMVAADDWVVTERSYALDHAGDDDYIEIGTSVSVSANSPFSIILNFRSETVAGDDGIFTIASDQVSGFGSFSGSLAFAPLTFGGRSGEGWSHFRPVNDFSADFADQWHSLAITFDGIDSTAAASFKLYWDGKAEAIQTTTQINLIANETRIGRYEHSGGNAFFDGQIGPVSIYNRALTANEIAAMAAGASPMILARRVVGRVPAPSGLQTVTLLSAVVSQPTITPSVTQPGITTSMSQPTITVTAKNDIE